jgi:translation initiation factor 1
MRKPGQGGLVYSTESGRMCPACRRPADACACAAQAAPARGDGIVRLGRESKGRAGKTVTVVRGLTEDPAALAELGRRLRALCGTGGTVKDGAIELQGDHCARLMRYFSDAGRPVRRSGG